jgi:2-dehydro-3-deoxygluconokinase
MRKRPCWHMIKFLNANTAAVGEAMVEMAPADVGLYRRGFAGDTFNTAWHMAQALGEQARVGYVTRVGCDSISESFVAELRADSLDATHVGRDPQRNMGLYLIELDGVERHFHYWRSASAARQLAADRGALQAAFSGAGLIHLSGITLAILAPEHRENLFAALTLARQSGTVVSFDPNIRPRLWQSLDEVRQVIPRALANCDIALPSFDDEKLVWGDAHPSATIARLVGQGAMEVAVKDGAGPIAYWAEGAEAMLPTPVVGSICDTTGAGDAFNAGYLAARLIGQSPAKAVTVGQQFSGRVIQHYGARIPKSAIPALP